MTKYLRHFKSTEHTKQCQWSGEVLLVAKIFFVRTFCEKIDGFVNKNIFQLLFKMSSKKEIFYYDYHQF